MGGGGRGTHTTKADDDDERRRKTTRTGEGTSVRSDANAGRAANQTRRRVEMEMGDAEGG